MPVTLMCPNLICRKVLAVPDSMRGKRVRCGYCETTFSVPSTGALLAKRKKEAAQAAKGGEEDVFSKDDSKNNR